MINTDMTTGEVVTSPIFSLSKDASLKQALNKIIGRQVRRILISGTQRIVSDRQVIDYVFRIFKLDEDGRKPSGLLDADFDLENIRPQRVGSKTKINKAAPSLYARGGKGGCLGCDNGVVTPWDVTMKPRKKKKLAILGSKLQAESQPLDAELVPVSCLREIQVHRHKPIG